MSMDIMCTLKYVYINIYCAFSQLASRWQCLIVLAPDVGRSKSRNLTGLKPRRKSGAVG